MSHSYDDSLETVDLNTDGEQVAAGEIVGQGFPVQVDSRYSYVKRLGRGGSGLVYQAYDDVLQRHVALKFLINQSSQNLPTLVAEARAQANVDHPNICPVYEVVETKESVYLVMQFIDGQSLQALCATLSLEQNLLLIAKAAEALQASHSLGIIHRDFKPMNIMIRNDEQGMHPVLVDFGLACSVQNAAHEKQGSTPHFSAPEQSAKNVSQENKTTARIDRRADVFALGATLYYCLTGKLPPKISHSPQSSALSKEPSWLQLPLDVRFIIERCMAYSPAQRYDTATQVASDILRYLNGEPISTRKGMLYRVGKRLVKHKWLSLAFGLVFVVSSGAFINQRIEAQRQLKREQMLVAFNDQIKALEYEVLLTLSAPRHSISDKREQWQQQVSDIVQRLPSMEGYLQGAAHYAIGRSYLVVNDLPQALSHLTQAHALETSPKVSFYLAMAYSQMYRRAVDRLRAVENDKVRKERLLEAQNRFRKPAIELLQANLSAAPFPSYAQALLAYLQDDWGQVLRVLEEENELPSWFYLDELLRGDIALTQASAKHEAGDSLSEVLPLIALAERNYNAAASIAPSDPWIASKPYLAALVDLRAHIQAGETWKNDALTQLENEFVHLVNIDRQNPEIHAVYGQLAHFYGLNLHYTDGNALPWFDLAKTQLIEANTLASENDKYWMALGRFYSSEVKIRREKNLDSTEALQQAISALEQVSEQQRDYYYFNEMGTLSRHRAIAMQRRGEDAQPIFKQAVDYYVAANRLFPEHIGSLINAASTLQLSSDKDDVAKRSAALTRAKTLVKKALERDAQHFVANYYLTAFELESVRLALYNDKDATRSLDAATTQMLKAQAINAEHPYLKDLALRLQRYNAENEFNHTVQWQPRLLDVVEARRALHQQYPSNTTVMANYVGATTSIIAMRLHLGMEVDDLIAKVMRDIQAFPQFNNANAYQALLTLFSHWHNTDYIAKPLLHEFDLRGEDSMQADWAKAVILAFDAQSIEVLNSAEKRVMDNKGLLPVYKKQLVAWMRQKESQLSVLQ